MKAQFVFAAFLFICSGLVYPGYGNTLVSDRESGRPVDGCRPSNFPSMQFDQSNVFPQDGSLHRPEDGKALPDGRIIVVDEKHGLRIVERNGSSRPFGDFKSAGFDHAPPESATAPNGVFLEPDGKHLLVSDVYTGMIFRVDLGNETVTKVYDHPFGVNSLILDSRGNIWFTQSAENRLSVGGAELYKAIDRPLESGAVYFLKRSGKGFAGKAVEVASGIFFANGIALNRNESHLFVAETMVGRILRYDVNPDKSSLSNREVYAYVMSPDNLAVDSEDNLFIASPLRNSIMAVDAKCRSLHVVFSAPSKSNYDAQNSWVIRSIKAQPLLSLLNPESSKPLPGFITGMFWSYDRKTFYITGLGNALLKYGWKPGE